MFAGSKARWFLPIFFFTFIIILSISFLSHTEHNIHARSRLLPDSLTSVLSPRTVRAINQDRQLHDAILSFADVLADTTSRLGEQVQSEHLKSFGLNLTSSVAHLRLAHRDARQRRDLIGDIGSAFQGLFGGGSKSGGLNLTNGLSGIFSGIGDSLVGSLATPALFLGIGLGMGASNGLNLTNITTAQHQAKQVANAYNASATGFNLVAQNLGSGLAGQMAPSLGSTSDISLGPIAFALASGIGDATAFGLNLTQDRPIPSNGSNLEAVAGNLGIGITQPIVSKVDLQTLMSNAGGNGTSKLLEQLPAIMAAAGTGLGEGAKNGLGLTKTPSSTLKRRQQMAVSGDSISQVDIPGAVGSFTQGLAQAFLSGSDLSKLSIMGNKSFTGTLDLQKMLRPLAAGAGAGIGMGIAVGLDFKTSDPKPFIGSNIPAEDMSTALVAEGFAQNLLANLLANSTALEKGKELLNSGQSDMFKYVKISKVTEGFARGAIDGIANAMSSVGGLKNLISGNISADAMANVPVLEQSKFDDSTNGTAISLARGLMGPGTILVAELIRNITTGEHNLTSVMGKRGVGILMSAPGVAPIKSLALRQDSPALSSSVDGDTIQLAAQKGIDLLTCRGVGGIASAALGLMDGADFKKGVFGKNDNLEESLLNTLPGESFVVTSEGNNFKVVMKGVAISVNEWKGRDFVIITALHIGFSILGFLVFLPLYLVWGVAWRISVFTSCPTDENKNRKWRMMWLVAFSLFGLSGVVLGVVGMGNAQHFRDAHGILGLVTLILILPTIIVTAIRLWTSTPHPSSSSFSSFKAASALLKTPQRIYLISGKLIQILLVLGQVSSLQGFSTLRSITLCLTDAVLSHTISAVVTSILLTLQIGAIALLMMRIWLERRMASTQREPTLPILPPKSSEKSKSKSKSKHKESLNGSQSSIVTFGFETQPRPINLVTPSRPDRPDMPHRRTEDYKGKEDMQISGPYNVRKEGSEISPLVPAARWYNPKTAGYLENQRRIESEKASASRGLDEEARTNVVGSGGPSAGGVTVGDLWPPMSSQGIRNDVDRGESRVEVRKER